MAIDTLHPGPPASTRRTAPLLPEVLRRWATERGDQVAYRFLKDGEEEAARWTWAEVHQRAQAIAATLDGAGARGERAILLFPPGLEFVAALLGCFMAGAVAVPCYPPRRRDERLRAIAGDCRPAWVLTTRGAETSYRRKTADLPELATARWLGTDDLAIEPGWQPPALDGSEIALLQYTSGSTGDPRGVLVRGAQLAHNEELIQRAFELDGSSVIVSWLPTYHDMGLIGGVLQPLWAGASCVMMSPGAFLRRPARWLEAISRYRGTTSGGPNFAFDLCVRRISAEERADLDLGSWRVAFNGAEPIHSGTVERFARAFADSGFERAAFLPCYGLAEATLFVSGGPRRDPPVLFTVERAALAAGRVVAGAPGLEGGQTLVASGRPHQEVRIVDPETRRLAAAGTVGEIWLASPSIADGYWDRGPATRETFRARLDPPTEDTFLRTGDLGFLREGQLFVTGRLKDLVILRGRNHYPNDLERTAELSHPELQSGSCAAFAVEDDAQEQLVLVFEGGPRMDAEGARAVAASIRRELGRNHEVQASQVVAVRPGTLPRTSSGKVQRYRCRQLFLAGELDEIGRSRLTPQAEGPAPDAAPGALRREVLALPETEQPNRLLGALARLATRAARLEVDALPEDAPLSSLGLDSLAAVEVAHALETGLEIEVSSADLLEAPSLEVLAADLAYRLRQGAAAPPPLATRGPELVEGPRPLSAAEHSIWLVDQLAPERGLYNLFGAAWVRGLDEAALERAVLRLTRRHPALRTAFESPRGEPLRRTVSTVAAPVRRIEGHGWDEATVERALTAEARRPFDLAVPPLLRLVMVRLADDRHAVLLGAHHLITDFWSWGVLTGELETLYRLELAQTADLPPAPAIDLDTIRTWQQERLERHAVSWLESWDRELGAVPEILDLPTDRPRPAVQSFRGLAVRHTLSAELRDDLEALARREDSTLFTLLAATFQVLLHRHTGQDDLVVGTPTAGRAAAALRDVVGCFVNPVPLRADLAGDPTFVDFLGATRRRVSAALHLQELPFGQLVEHRLPRRDASRQPLFQALFVFHRPHLETTGDLGAFPLGARDGKTRFAGLELTPMALDTGNALFDLTLTLGEAGGGLSIALEMAADLYDATTARRLIGHYGNLLRNLVETPDERLSRLEVWSAAERWQVLGEWNAHANLEGDDTEPATDLYALFAASARRWPAAVALELGDGSHRTYGELAERAERLARHLRHLGVGPEVPVAICLEREEELIVSMLAVLAAGGAYVPLDPGYPGARLDLMLRDSGARLLLARELPVAVDGVQRLDPARLDRANLDGTSPDGTRLDPPAEALAYVIYTSGSTGTPKGVAITHASALAMVRWALGTWTAAELETVAAVTSVCFDLSIFEIFVPLAAGGRIVLARDALALPEHPAAATVSLLNTVPSAVAELLRAGRLPAAVRAVNLAGEPLAPELARQVLAQPFVERLFDLYGPTEDTTYSTAQRVTAGDAARIGRPIVGTTADLRDHRGQPVPLGAVGEIVLGGDGLARGYVRRPARTAAAFVPDPLAGRGDRAPGARIYRTGDLARFDATGRLIFLGRRDHQVKLRGFRIELGEVEATLRRHPAVAEAAAQVRSPGQGGELLVAFVTPADAGTGIDAETLRTFLGERLPPAMVPSRFVVLEQLPRTLTGKLDRTALPLPEAPAAAGTSPTSPSELLLASLYGELLGHEDVRREDDFFALGGHSLMAARLVAEVRAAVGVELPLQSVFHSPSVGALARVVDQLRADGGERRAAEPLPAAVPRPLPDDAPVSFAQERIWFLERLTPGTATYHLPFAIELDGPLRLGALERSLCRVGERQEALRTAFADPDGRPVQRVRESLEAPLAIVSLEGLSGGDARREAERLAETTAHRPFALDRAPLWRALLLRLGDDAHRLVINLHHAVADGRSLEIVSRDLATFYRQALEDRDDAPAALPLQPADLAASERERWRRGDHQPALRAAVERLGEPPEPLRLPTDRPRTSGRERLGGELAVRVGAALTARLGDLARSAGATPFMGLLALYQVLLSRWSGQSRLGIGFPVDQRDPVATQEVVGLLVNTAVVFADLGPRPASLRHLETVREAALAAYDERRLPFEQLVEALVPERQLGENPLFQAAFALQPSVLAPVFPGLESRVRALSAGAAKFDLFLFLHPQPDGGLEGTLEYDRSLFDPSTVQRLWRSFRVLLESAVDDPAAPVDRLSLLGSAEAHQLKTEWNDTARATDPGWPLERFLAQARRRPTAPALDDGHRVWSYAALAQTVLRLAHALRQRGIREEDVVALAYPRSAHQVALLLAVVAAGAAYVPLDPAHPTAHLRQLLEDSGARLLLAPPGLVTGELTGPWGRLGFDELLAAGEASSALEPRPPLDGLQAVYTIYTSGSTGRPKGVTISHHSLRNLVDWKVARIDLRPGDRTTLVASVGFDASVYELWPSLAAGACLCVPPAETVLDAPALARWLRDEAITVAFLPTPVAELVLETDDLRGCSLRQVHVGGDRLLRRPPASSDWILLNCYGPAENTVASTLARVAAQAEPGTRQLSAPDIGRPIDNTRAVVVGSGGVPQPVGAIGELVVAGESLGRGYRGRPAETALRFVPDPESPLPGGRRYRTGDRVRLRPDGALDFLGRVDDQVKIRGQRLEPREVEIVLASHPRVSEAVVVARQSPAGLRLLAYCVVRGGELPGEELRAWLGQRLPSAMVPAAVVVLDAFPLTRHGKIDRGALPEPAAPRPTGERSGPIQELLAALWHELLGTLPGPDDEFFDLGGHSLLATRLVSAVRQRFGVELPVRAVFEASTLAAQAELLETAMRQAARGERPPLVRSDRSGELPLSYAQQRLWFLDQLEPESPLYNVPLALRLRGHLSLRGLATAMTTIVRRHEALRSEFAASEGTVVQRVLPAAPQRLPVVDLSALPGDRRQRLAADLARREAARALHLERGELVRTVALRLADDEHWWLLTLHHIATDGWSMGILLEELAVLYQSASEGVDAALPELAVQYGDFAAWQRRWLTGDRLAAEIDHWRRRLAEPPILDLPTDRPRPALQSFTGAQRQVHLPAPLVAALGDLARRSGTTLFMVLLAGFGTLLSRLAGQRDLVVGSPVANRTQRETEGLIGFFVNMLALRLDLSATSFAGLLERVRRVALDAYGHQELPFERVVEELGVQRDLSRNPLFQVVFTLQNTTLEPPDLPGLDLEVIPVDSGTSRFDLTLTLVPRQDGALRGPLEYNTDLFDATTAARWMSHLATLLGEAARQPELPLDRLHWLDDAQRHQIEREWNDTALRRPLAALPQLFARQAMRTPDALALVDRDERWTYRQLDERVRRLAAMLRPRGAAPGALVGLVCDRSAAMVAALLAILETGAAYLPLDPEYPAERLRFILDDARAALVVAGRRQRALVADHPHVVIEEALGAAPPASAGVVPRTPALDDLAYVIYTSGSTGRPKGVAVSHRNACNLMLALDELLGSEPTSLLAVTSISFDISVLELLWTLTRGSRVVLQGDRAVELYGASGPSTRVSAKAIDFSLFYFADDSGSEDPNAGGRYRLLLEGARFADRAGLSAVWTPERHFHAFGGLYPNPSVTGAAVAAVTERVAIRAGSVVLPLHNPLRVAEEWSVVDNLSGGRVGISVASGWHANDFVLAPVSADERRAAFERRKQTMLDHVDILRRLWRGEPSRGVNALGAEVELSIHPRPVQPELPLWLTAAGNPETFKLAGSLGMGLLTHLLTQSRDELRAKIEVYRNAWRDAGHEGAGHVTLMVHTFVDRDPQHALEVVRGPFTAYLESSLGLLRPIASSMGVDLDADDFDPDTLRLVLEHAFTRFAETGALFGSADSCLEKVEDLKELGVDEIGCLIDFGCPVDAVLASFEELGNLMRWSNPQRFPEAAADRSVAAQLRRHGVETLQCTPSLARLLAAEPAGRAALGGLERLLLGGEAVPEDLVAQLSTAGVREILDVYGPTETTVWSTADPHLTAHQPVTIGRPLANTRTHVVAAGGRLQPPGVPGELWIGGDGVTRGYLGRPGLTAEKFVPDPFSGEPGARLYRTGDRVRLDPSGRLGFLGRLDHQVKIAGHRIEPGEVEALLRQLPGVAEAVVVLHREDSGAPALAAYVVPERWARDDGPEDTFRLPDGRRIAHLGAFQTSVAVRELFEDDWYWKFGLELPEDPCVFDVGANIGLFTLQVVDRRPDARVVCFEPLPPTFAALERNLEAWVPNGRAVKAGVGERAGEVTFTFYPQMSGLSGRYADPETDRLSARAIIESGLEDAGSGAAVAQEELDRFLDVELESEEFSCRLTTLSAVIDELGVERIDLLKIDVERAELDVLRGLRDDHWPRVDQVVAEVDTRENLELIVALLGERGFEVRVEDFFDTRARDGSEVLVKMLYARRPGLPPAPPPAPLSTRRRPVTATALRGYLAERLAAAMVPSHFVLLDELPRTPNGKIDRRALPSPRDAAAPRGQRYVAPQLDSERAMAKVWQEVLGAERIGLDENFFELGGTSLLLVQLRSRIQQQLGYEVALVDLFRYPTVGSLDRFLRERQGTAEGDKGFERVDDRMEKKRQALDRRRQRPRGRR